MAVRIKSTTFDCADPCWLAQFWSQLTGFAEDPDNPNFPTGPRARCARWLCGAVVHRCAGAQAGKESGAP